MLVGMCHILDGEWRVLTNKLNTIAVINWWALVGSGVALAIGYTLDFKSLGVVAVFAGWLFAFLACVIFLMSAILFALGRVANFWKSPSPLNFGFVLVSILFLLPKIDVIPLAVATIAAAAIALFINVVGVSRWKWLPLVLVILFLIPVTAPSVYGRYLFSPIMFGLMLIFLFIIERLRSHYCVATPKTKAG